MRLPSVSSERHGNPCFGSCEFGVLGLCFAFRLGAGRLSRGGPGRTSRRRPFSLAQGRVDPSVQAPIWHTAITTQSFTTMGWAIEHTAATQAALCLLIGYLAFLVYDEGAYPATLNDSMPAALSSTHTGAKGCVRHYRTAHCIPFLSAARRPARIALFSCSHCSPSPGRMEEANESFT